MTNEEYKQFINEYCRNVGNIKIKCDDCKFVEDCVDYGWHELCETPSKDFRIAKAQLRDMYHEVCQRSKEESVNNYVLGESGLLDGVNIKMLE